MPTADSVFAPAFVEPPALRAGQRVALLSPAGPSAPDRIERAIARCEAFGLIPVPGRSSASRSGYLAGPDDDRLADLRRAIEDPSIDAIWAIRGGYGVMRILAALDLSPMRERPRAFMGFSDNTALHLALARIGVVSYHAPHAGGEFPEFTQRSFLNIMFERGTRLAPPPDQPARALRSGSAEGILAGGNLTMLAAACGTPWALDGRGRILLMEDVNEPAYRVDRAFTQLRLAGCLEGVRAIGFGGFTQEDTDESPAGLDPVLGELTAGLGVPVVAGLPFGHIDEQWTIPLGARARLDAESGTLELV